MKTQVIMKRKLFDAEISQQSKTGYLSGTELENAGNNYRLLNKLPKVSLQEFLRLRSTKDFIAELESNINDKAKIATKGRNGQTWLHPYLFIDFALYISPKLKVEVYKWLYDELLKYRNSSGDSYKKMTGALYANTKNKRLFADGIKKLGRLIKTTVGVTDWESATENQLQKRDKIHENIALLCDVINDNNTAIRIGIKKALEN